jgi:hypothetical protein
MNQNERRGPGRGLLLLIPIGLLIAKGVGRRRRMLAGGAGRPGGHGHGGFRHGGFGPGGVDAEGRYSFTLPPKIESVLDAWHTRVHAAAENAPASPPADTATA